MFMNSFFLSPVFIGIAIFLILVVLAIIRSAIVNSRGSGSSDGSAPAFNETSPSSASSTQSSSSAKIFINGGAPAFGNIMGKIVVDGKPLDLKYTDAPIEISVSSGKHHIIVEGGLCGDARIDRAMDFGTSNVLTIDMPGEGDEDIIKHQMISEVEYLKTLDECSFTVTRKCL